MIAPAPPPAPFFTTAEKILAAMKNHKDLTGRESDGCTLYMLPLDRKMHFDDQTSYLSGYINSILALVSQTNEEHLPLSFCPHPQTGEIKKKICAVATPAGQEPDRQLIVAALALIKSNKDQMLRKWIPYITSKKKFAGETHDSLVSQNMTYDRGTAETMQSALIYTINFLERFHHCTPTPPEDLPKVIEVKKSEKNAKPVYAITISNSTVQRLKDLEGIGRSR